MNDEIRSHSITMFMDNMRGRGGQKISVFVHAQGIKTVHAGPPPAWTVFIPWVKK